jgi:hypothetical protein
LVKRGEIKEQIVRILLNYPEGKLSKYRVWKLSEGSQTWTYDLLNELEKKGYIEDTKVTNIRDLFEYWKKIRVKPSQRNYLIKDPMNTLEKAQNEYALTTYRAENLIQNHLFPSRTDIYCRREDQEKWHSLLSEKGAVGGGNLRTLYASKYVLFNAQHINKYRVVSTPQLILDLLVEGGPAAEAAEMLIDKMVSRSV